MHLLNAQDGAGHPSLFEIPDDRVPPYAILSHTWGDTQDEVSFKDITNGIGDKKPGFKKILFCKERATMDNIDYFWIDTCCIDRSSSAELSEAINSMWKYYQRAAKCYVYLSDISSQNKHLFRHSRWFTRGWTLQELLAPQNVEFFSFEGCRLGDKFSLTEEISCATRIPQDVIRGLLPLSEVPPPDRLAWARWRETKKAEDRVYSLLGIFDVNMPLIYGEGEQKALKRLMREIKLHAGEHSSYSIDLDWSRVWHSSQNADINGETLSAKCTPKANSAKELEIEHVNASSKPSLASPSCVGIIEGQSGNISVGGSVRKANTGISFRGHTSSSPLSGTIHGQSGSIEVGQHGRDLNTGIMFH